MAKQKQPYRPAFSQQQRDFATAIVANLIGDEVRTALMGRYQLKPEMLPDDMKIEKMVLRYIYKLESQDLPADVDTINDFLTVQLGKEAADKELMRLISYQDPPEYDGLASHAQALGDWIESQRVIVAANEMVRIMAEGPYDVAQNYHDATNVWADAAPNSVSTGTIVVASDMHEQTLEQLADRHALWKSGEKPGPTLLWGMEEHIPFLDRGEMMTWMAKSKHGKSTVGVYMADHWAYGMGEGYYVDFIHLETKGETLMMRRLTQELLIPSNQLHTVDLKQEPYAGKIAAMRERLTKHERAHTGRQVYSHIPGATMDQIEHHINRQYAIARHLGMKYVAIIDYLQVIEPSSRFRSDTEAINDAANRLKKICESMGDKHGVPRDKRGIWMLLFAQANPEAKFKGRRTSWNGSKSLMRSQYFVQTERYTVNPDNEGTDEDTGLVMSSEDAPVQRMHPKTGVYMQQNDGIGQPMFYHRVGEIGSNAYFNITAANENRGGKVGVRFMNAYYTIEARPEDAFSYQIKDDEDKWDGFADESFIGPG